MYFHLYCARSTQNMNVAIFWNIAPCSPNVNRRFGGAYQLHFQSKKSAEQGTRVQQLTRHNYRLIFGSEDKADPFLRNVRLHIRTTRRYIPEDGNTH
jgi:hypothetical protein